MFVDHHSIIMGDILAGFPYLGPPPLPPFLFHRQALTVREGGFLVGVSMAGGLARVVTAYKQVLFPELASSPDLDVVAVHLAEGGLGQTHGLQQVIHPCVPSTLVNN